MSAMNRFELTQKKIDELLKMRILVIGDLMLDVYLSGSVNRTSPEAPVPIVEYREEHDIIGGAGNVANNLAHFGSKVAIAGILGSDDWGSRLRKLLWSRRIDTSAVLTDSDRPTTVKTRVTAGGQQVLRIDRERTNDISEAMRDRLLDWLQKNMRLYDGVIVSDYKKGVLRDDLLQSMLELAKSHGVPTVVDPKGRGYERYSGCVAIKPNLQEATLETALTLRRDEDVVEAAKIILGSTDCAAVVLSRGADGLTVLERDTPPDHIPAVRHEVFDVTGAGDTVVAFFGLGLFAGWPVNEAARLGNLASSITVLKHGNGIVSPQELLAASQQFGDQMTR